MILPAADELLAPVMAIDGFLLGALIDGSTGMVLASRENQPSAAAPVAAAGAADIMNVLTLLSGKLASGESLEDVMVTFSDSLFMVRPVRGDANILLLVIADRKRTNLAMAHRRIRDFCTSLAA